jgi:hypothetical protein
MDYKVFKSTNKMIILEKGINTDYIYTLLTSLFYVNSQSINKILDLYFIRDENDYDKRLYLQEFIRSYIIPQLRQGLSIEKKIINRLRIFLYRIGLFDKIKKDTEVLCKLDICNFYEYLISDILNYNIIFEIIDIQNNVTLNKVFSMIELDVKSDTKIKKIVNLTTEINKWISTNILKPNSYYKFKNIPQLIPIKINRINNSPNIYINIMEGIKFNSNSDNIQQLIVFEIHSIICKDEKNNYYSIVKQYNEWFGFSENRIPSNFIIDMKNINQVKKIMLETEFIIYKIN